LEDHQLVFRGYSKRWGGSVATVQRSARARVQGLVYVLTPADIDALDRCEGVPFAYERATCLVRCWDGRRRRVHTCVMAGPLREIALGAAVPYLAQIRRAYARLGFDSSVLARVRTAEVRT
jgi:gamma-glutamylcyclotransferase